jgi:hypothetical protein
MRNDEIKIEVGWGLTELPAVTSVYYATLNDVCKACPRLHLAGLVGLALGSLQ